MKETRILAVLTGIALLIATVGCSDITPAEVTPTANIDATVAARAKELVAAQPTPPPMVVVKEVTPTANIDATVAARAKELVAAQPTPTPVVVVKEVTPTSATEPTIAPAPTDTSVPTNTPVRTNVPVPTATPKEVPTATPPPEEVRTDNPPDSLGLSDIVLRDPNAAVLADFNTPAPLADKLTETRAVNWTELTTSPINLTRFSFGEATTTNLFVLTDAAAQVDERLHVSAGLAGKSTVTNDLLLRSMFQFVEISPATGQYAIYSTKHGNYAVDVADDGVSLVLRDVRSVYAYNAGTGAFLTFTLGASPTKLIATGRYVFDAAQSTADKTLAFDAEPRWTDREVVLTANGSLKLADAGTFMALYQSPIALEIPSDFNPESQPRVKNNEYYDPGAEEGDRFAASIDRMTSRYSGQVASKGIDGGTQSAAQAMLQEIDAALANQGSQTRYPKEFYVTLRDGMLRRTLLVEESTDGRIGDLTIPYVYFTNEMDEKGDYHPFMVIATHGVPEALALLGDVPRPPGDGIGPGGYGNQNVTRSYYIENFLLRIPMRDYGEVNTVEENNLNGRSLADDRNESNYDHHNYASTNSSAVAIDGVVVFPSYNNTLHLSQEAGELSVRGMHSGRGLGVHYHADPHSAALTHTRDNTEPGLNLYNNSDYVGHRHPPIVSIGFDGVAGYGFYPEDDTLSDGVDVALDEFGAHEHDDYGYHYHAFRTDRQSDRASAPYISHELGPLGAWAGRINYVPDFMAPGKDSVWSGNPKTRPR